MHLLELPGVFQESAVIRRERRKKKIFIISVQMLVWVDIYIIAIKGTADTEAFCIASSFLYIVIIFAGKRIERVKAGVMVIYPGDEQKILEQRLPD